MKYRKYVDKYMIKRKPNERYASFDYCFNYFQNFNKKNKVQELAKKENILLSCLHLGFFLASWGMYRGGTEIFKKSIMYLVPAIKLAANRKYHNLWKVDIENYTEEKNIELILLFYSQLKKLYRNQMTDTLASKIMLGIFGNIPAIDDNFRKGFKISKKLSKHTLQKIYNRYNSDDSLKKSCNKSIPTYNFYGGKTNIKYTKAKIFDMIYFTTGLNKK